MLGRVDELDQVEARNDSHERAEVPCGLIAAQGDTLEALELAHGDLDARPGFVENVWKVRGSVLCVGLLRDDRHDAARAAQGAVGLAVVALVADGGARRDVGAEIEKHREVRAIALLSAGEIEGDGQAVLVGLQMDLGGEAAPGAAKRLILLPPFAPAAETWARTTVESNIWMRWAVELIPAKVSKKASKTPALLNRSKRFHTLFHLPKLSGKARQVML